MNLLPLVNLQTALFLDFDGTIADIAPAPDAVEVHGGTVHTLSVLQQHLGGAMAIITGRPVAEIDHFLHPLRIPVAGEHGAQCRLADGSMQSSITAPSLDQPLAAMERLRDAHTGLLIEHKPHSIALHYRHAPQLEDVCLEGLLPSLDSRDDLELLRGKCVLEVKAAGVDKGQAIRNFMGAAPFAGRVPFFAGDDVTDEAGFVAVQALGGHGIKIGEGPTAANHRCLSPAAFRGWLASARAQLTAGSSGHPENDEVTS
jgi:trehalose 6-phosphate phosphatase